MLIRIVLEGEGLRVVGEAAEGTSAPARVAEKAPRVAVVDLALPGTEGPELVGILRSAHPALGIVVYSGNVEPDIEERVLELGADRFVPKSRPVQDLAEIVREVAARHTGAP